MKFPGARIELFHIIVLNALVAAAQLGSSLLFVRLISPEIFGVFAVGQGLSGLVLLYFASGTFHIPALTSESSGSSNESQIWRLCLSGFAACLLATVPWSFFWSEIDHLVLLTLASATCLTTPLFNLMSSKLRPRISSTKYFTFQLGAWAASVAIIFNLVFLLDAPGFFFLQIPLYHLAFILFAVTWGSEALPKFSRHLFRNVAVNDKNDKTSISKYLMLIRAIAALSYVNATSLRWAVNVAGGSGLLGQLNRAESLTLGPMGQIQSAFVAYARKREIHLIKEINSSSFSFLSNANRLFMVVLILGAGACVALSDPIEQIVSSLLGPKYTLASQIAPSLFAAYLFFASASFLSFLLETSGMPKVSLYSQFISLAFTGIAICSWLAGMPFQDALWLFACGAISQNIFFLMRLWKLRFSSAAGN